MGDVASLGSYRITLTERVGHQVVGVIDAPRGRVRCEVSGRGGSLTLLIGTMPRNHRLVDLQREVMRPLPIIAWRVREALAVEEHIKAGHFQKAHRALMRLRDYNALRVAADLRLADLQLLSGRIPSAHLGYVMLARSLLKSNLGLLVRVRAAELSYVIEGHQLTSRLVQQLTTARGKTGNAARFRAVALLLETGQAEEAMRLAMPAEHRTSRRLLNRALLLSMRTHLNYNRPYQAALSFLRAESAVDDHPEVATIRHLAGKAYLKLGLPTDAATQLHLALAETQDGAIKEQIIHDLTRAYREGRHWHRALQTANFYAALYPNSPRINDVLNIRAGLLLREGNVKGAAADVQRLGLGVDPAIARLLRLQVGDFSAITPSYLTKLRELAPRPSQRRKPDRRVW